MTAFRLADSRLNFIQVGLLRYVDHDLAVGLALFAPPLSFRCDFQREATIVDQRSQFAITDHRSEFQHDHAVPFAPGPPELRQRYEDDLKWHCLGMERGQILRRPRWW